MKNQIIILSFLALLNTNAFAKKSDGGSDRGGGNAYLMRSKILENKKRSLIKKVEDLFNGNSMINIKSSMAWFQNADIKLADPKAQAMLLDMRQKGFAANVYATPFQLSDSCLDKNGISKTATTEMNQKGSFICINVKKLVEAYGPFIQDSDIVGLLMHEYSHHFGYADEDHSFAAEIALRYQLDSEERAQEAGPLNYFIQQ